MNWPGTGITIWVVWAGLGLEGIAALTDASREEKRKGGWGKAGMKQMKLGDANKRGQERVPTLPFSTPDHIIKQHGQFTINSHPLGRWT